MGGRPDFMEIAAPHLDAVWSVARRMTADRCAAEDAVQETYLRAYAAYHQFRGESVRPWLLAICVNVIRSEHRRSLRRPDEDLGAELPERHDVEDVSEVAIRRVQRDTVAAALAQVPDPNRIAVVLVDIGGLTTREAAEVVGAPLGTMLSRVHRGRRQLGAIIESYGHCFDA